jgi:hypothetical protein
MGSTLSYFHVQLVQHVLTTYTQRGLLVKCQIIAFVSVSIYPLASILAVCQLSGNATHSQIACCNRVPLPALIGK